MKMFVRPKAGVKVRDPITKRHIPESGKSVPRNSFWIRKLADGDVLVVECNPIPDSGGSR